MYRLHKFRFILCKTQPFVQEISARDGESFRLAAPPQWLQKENNFLTKSVFVGFLPLQAAVKQIFLIEKVLHMLRTVRSRQAVFSLERAMLYKKASLEMALLPIASPF